MAKFIVGVLFWPLGVAFVTPSRTLMRSLRLVRHRAGVAAETAPVSFPSVQYDHLQVFVDKLQPFENYKLMEKKLNWFAAAAAAEGLSVDGSEPRQVDKLRALWLELNYNEAADPTAFVGHGQDIVEQLQVGMGWRVTAALDISSTAFPTKTSNLGNPCRSVLLSSAAGGAGLNIVVTEAPATDESTEDTTVEDDSHELLPFSSSGASRFKAVHGGAQGIGVLGFGVPWGQLDDLAARYAAKHPNLVLSMPTSLSSSSSGSDSNDNECRVFEVCAYYVSPSSAEDSAKTGLEGDAGTVLRFVERRPPNDSASSAEGGSTAYKVLPGLAPVAAEFDGTASAAFADHWVSNVVDRVSFLSTLEDTLGFTPKVDFNAGVVAAGEAQIESTVTGNTQKAWTSDPMEALADSGQVFLPINNALSPVGHVHGYLEELGQGIQHVASRVADLPNAVQRANDYRAITGLGLAFLSIPRTYYGLLDIPLLEECLNQAYAQDKNADGVSSSAPPTVDKDLCKSLFAALQASGAVDSSGAADFALAAALIAAEEPETEDEKAVREAREAAVAAEKEAAAAEAAGGTEGKDPMAASLAEWAGKTPSGGESTDTKKARVGCEALDLALDSLAAPGRTVPEPVRRGASAALRFSAYRNLHALLEDKLDEAAYLSIVRNQILVDVQGGDVLMQIFTQCILQRQPGEEAPFLEFIQRLCRAPSTSDSGNSGVTGNSKSDSTAALIRPGCGGFGIRNFLTLFLSIESSKAMKDEADAVQNGNDAAAAFHARRVELFTQQLVEANPLLNVITAAMAEEGAALAANDTDAVAKATALKAAANEALQANSAKYRDLMKAHRESLAFE